MLGSLPAAINPQAQRSGTPAGLLPGHTKAPGRASGDPFPTGTLVKGFLLSFSTAARQVSSRELSRARAMSANLNCNNPAPSGSRWLPSLRGGGGRGGRTREPERKGHAALPPASGPGSPCYLDALELGEGHPKGPAVLSVVHGTIEGGLGDAQGLGGDANAPHVQGLLWGRPQSAAGQLGPRAPAPLPGSPWLS